MSRTFAALSLGLVLLSCLSTQSRADIPRLINYQGKVTDTGGIPVPDGTYTMWFRIYSAATGGSVLWNSGAVNTTVTGGVFDVLLGLAPQPAIGLDFTHDYWLSVVFDGVEQTPRQQMTSVGYAYMASGLVPGTEVSGTVTSGTEAAIKGINTALSGSAYGLYGQSNSSEGYGIYGVASATGSTTYGVYGRNVSTTGSGVAGTAASTTGYCYGGGFASASVNGSGVFGFATAATGQTYGVYGQSISTGGCGVYGVASATTGTTYGGWFETPSTGGRAVYAHASATGGTTYGVYGLVTSTAGRAVYGEASALSGTTYGLWGVSASTSGRGVYGRASAVTGDTYGGYFENGSTTGRAVHAECSATLGATYSISGWNSSTNGKAVYGWAKATSGVNYGGDFWTNSPTGIGAQGSNYNTSSVGYGLYGLSQSNSGFGVYASGHFAASGVKSCVVKTSTGPTLMYCQESPECWFEDFGEGRLVNGHGKVDLDPLFLETVTIDEENPMKVFVELHDEYCNGVAVKKGPSGFEVIERHGGTSNGTFDYRVVAKRKGFEQKRLDHCKAAESDPFLYPELRRDAPLEATLTD